eukprot:CAMPEP_0181043654 /NCGR_PEP_ID=MMETSP1070-20121207/12834_1 /TAXON_ID=265543 /ORGANISM="Minutocellus polymorphus, Strain NH13" /LENGTH=314 /DNA_ID=CAMNT_0023122019 /DNA_START=67 /DNA_END=1009 /DNA_ORIENTATION=-
MTQIRPALSRQPHPAERRRWPSHAAQYPGGGARWSGDLGRGVLVPPGRAGLSAGAGRNQNIQNFWPTTSSEPKVGGDGACTTVLSASIRTYYNALLPRITAVSSFAFRPAYLMIRRPEGGAKYRKMTAPASSTHMWHQIAQLANRLRAVAVESLPPRHWDRRNRRKKTAGRQVTAVSGADRLAALPASTTSSSLLPMPPITTPNERTPAAAVDNIVQLREARNGRRNRRRNWCRGASAYRPRDKALTLGTTARTTKLVPRSFALPTGRPRGNTLATRDTCRGGTRHWRRGAAWTTGPVPRCFVLPHSPSTTAAA